MKLSKSTSGILILCMLCLVLFLIRIKLSGGIFGFSLIWNLFLAWLPLVFILLAKRVFQKRLFTTSSFNRIIVFGLTFLWLIFFPNSPYIITDLIHLSHLPKNLIWFDSICIFVTALTGLAMGFYSLLIFQNIWNQILGKVITWLALLSSLVMSGFGLYLGRVVRLNSWDIFSNPKAFLVHSWFSLNNPAAIQYTLIFSIVLISLYLSFYYFQKDDRSA
jgi:uncharacterized membrane protein